MKYQISTAMLYCMVAISSFSLPTAPSANAYQKSYGVLLGYQKDFQNLQNVTSSDQQAFNNAFNNALTLFDRNKPVTPSPTTTNPRLVILQEQQAQRLQATLERQLLMVENVLNGLKRRYTSAALKTTLRADAGNYVEAQKIVNQTLKLLQPALVLLAQAQSAQALAFPVYDAAQGMLYRPTTIEKINDLYAQAAQTAYAIVKQFNQKNALSVSILKSIVSQWANFYCTLVQQQVNIIQKSSAIQKLYYKLLAQLATRLQGTVSASSKSVAQQGYLKIINNALSVYAMGSTALTTNFSTSLAASLSAVFSTALTQVSINTISPTIMQIGYAQNYYRLLIAIDPQTSQSGAQNMALMNVRYAESLLKKITLSAASSNETLRTEAQKAFSQAALYYKQAGSPLEQTYSAIAQALGKAQIALSAAQNYATAGNFDQGLTNYQQAQHYLAQGHDSVGQNFITYQIALLAFSKAEYAKHQQFAVFSSTYGKQLTGLQTFVSSGLVGQNLVVYKDLLAALHKASTTLEALYSNAEQYNQQVQNPDTIISNNSLISKKNSTFFSSLSSLSMSLLSVLDGAQQDTSTGLQQAERAYEQAIHYAQILDAQQAERAYEQAIHYAQILDAQQASLVHHKSNPLFILTTSTLSYQALVASFSAQAYLQAAHAVTDNNVLVLGYYIAAGAKAQYLPSTLQAIVHTYFTQTAHSPSDSAHLINQADNYYSQLMANDTALWRNTSNSTIYASKATNLAHTMLNNYWLCYILGDTPAFSIFMERLQNYKKAYRAQVPQQYFPEAYLVLLDYIGVLALQAAGKSVAAQTYKNNHLLPVLKNYLQQGQKLNATVMQPSISLTSLTAIQQLSTWQKVTQHLLEQQTTIESMYALPNTSHDSLLSVITNPSGSIYKDQMGGTSYALGLLKPRKAVIYEALGDQYFNQQIYDKARLYYQKAQKTYTTLQDSISVQRAAAAYQLSTTRYYAQFYENSVIGQGSATIGSFVGVPLNYQLDKYIVSVPSLISHYLPAAATLTKTALNTLALATASRVFLYNSLIYCFELSKAQRIFTALSSTTKLNASSLALGAQDQTTLQTILNNVAAYQAELKQRSTGTTPVVVLQGLPGSPPAYELWELNKPLAAVPLVNPPYANYPSAYSYYTFAHLLYGNSSVQLGSSSLVPGNEPSMVKNMAQKLIECWLSNGYQYQTKLDVLKSSSLYKTLLSIAPGDLTASLQPYKALYKEFCNLYGPLNGQGTYSYPMWVSYSIPLNQSLGLVNPGDTAYNNLSSLVATTYKQAGDELKNFLVGDPLGATYTEILKSVSSYYIAAIQGGYSADLYVNLGDIYKAIGAVLQSKTNYFAALAYFKNAQTYYQQAPSTAQQQENCNQINTFIQTVQLYAATTNLVAYAQKRFSIMNLANDDGSNTQLDFKQLMKLYWNAQNNDNQNEGLSAAQQQAVNDLQDLLLNALMFYSALASQTLAASHASTQQSQLLVTQYLKTIGSDLSSLASTYAFLQRSDLNKAITNFFKAQNLQSTNTSQPISLLHTNAALDWASSLYNALVNVYMNDFLAGVSADGYVALNNALGARIAAIQMNPAASIG